MAMTDHTFAFKRRFPAMKGGFRHGIVDITLGTGYESAGIAITAADLKLNRIYDFKAPAYVTGAADFAVTEVEFTSDTAIVLNLLEDIAGTHMSTTDDMDGIVVRCHYWGS